MKEIGPNFLLLLHMLVGHIKSVYFGHPSTNIPAVFPSSFLIDNKLLALVFFLILVSVSKIESLGLAFGLYFGLIFAFSVILRKFWTK